MQNMSQPFIPYNTSLQANTNISTNNETTFKQNESSSHNNSKYNPYQYIQDKTISTSTNADSYNPNNQIPSYSNFNYKSNSNYNIIDNNHLLKNIQESTQTSYQNYMNLFNNTQSELNNICQFQKK